MGIISAPRPPPFFQVSKGKRGASEELQTHMTEKGTEKKKLIIIFFLLLSLSCVSGILACFILALAHLKNAKN